MAPISVRRTALGAAALTTLGTVAAVVPATASPSFPVVCASAQVDAPRNQVTSFTLSCEDQEGNPVNEYVVLSAPTKSAIFTVDAATGEVSYRPVAGADGTDAFTFKGVVEGLGESAPTQAQISLGNERPACTAVAPVSVVHDRTAQVGLTCTDADGDALTIAAGTVGAAHGTVTIGAGVSYTPAAGYVGPDTFSLRATDGDLYSEEVTVTVSVTNAAPTCTSRTASVRHDRSTAIAVTCSDADGDPLTRSVAAQAQHGVVTVTGSTVTYRPATRYLGGDTFRITATDGIAAATPARVDVSVTNATPACSAGRVLRARGTARVRIPVSCTDRDGDKVAIVVLARPRYGKLVRQGDSWFYVAKRAMRGKDSFRLAGSDGVSRSRVASYVVSLNRR